MVLHMVVLHGDALGGKGVGGDDVGTCIEIFLVELSNDVGTGEIQNVVVAFHQSRNVLELRASEIFFR